MSHDPAITLRHAERTLSVLIAEALACDPAFLERFLAAVSARAERAFGNGADPAVQLRPDRRSRRNGWGLRLSIGPPAERKAVLIAHLHRYETAVASAAREAARRVAADGTAPGGVATVWIAPQAAIGAVPRDQVAFDAALAVEEATLWLAERAAAATGELADRLVFQLSLLAANAEAALEAERALEAAEHPFTRDYIAFMATHPNAPPLDAATTAARGLPALTTVQFDEDALPAWPFMPRTRLIHHLRAGAATVLIEGWGERAERVAQAMEPSLAETEFTLAPARGGPDNAVQGLFLVLEVPALDPARGFDAQRGAAERCVAGLHDLRRWYARRKPVARYWAEAAGWREPVGQGRLRGTPLAL